MKGVFLGITFSIIYLLILVKYNFTSYIILSGVATFILAAIGGITNNIKSSFALKFWIFAGITLFIGGMFI